MNIFDNSKYWFCEQIWIIPGKTRDKQIKLRDKSIQSTISKDGRLNLVDN